MTGGKNEYLCYIELFPESVMVDRDMWFHDIRLGSSV